MTALTLLAEACSALRAAGYPFPVLVGGAAVEFYTLGEVTSGDFDIVTQAQDALEKELIDRGFRRPTGQGALLRGLTHDDLLIGVEIVGSRLMDGYAEPERSLLVRVTDDSDDSLMVIGIEDLIADRLGQDVSALPAGDEAMRGQAARLWQLADGVDHAYLDRRIREETAGTYSLDDLKRFAQCA